MAKEYAQRFYHSKAWKECKKAFINYRVSVDGGMCQECNQQLGYIVHHKKHITKDNINDPDITLNHSNLEYVCKDCHDKFEGHGVGKSKGLLVVFDDNGQPIGRVNQASPLS